ncbi:MAG TPA: sugar phosphate isomerase/epimerase [Candidatus Deferrimicrobium sp.]|nr:sugar phosphate isomerase/epimerase [Candidatus Deferrimicrobium sp.]
MTRRYGFLAGLDFVALPAASVADELAALGYVAVSWPLARFDPSTTSAADRRQLVSDTRAAGLAVSEWVVQLDFVHPDAAVRAGRLGRAADSVRAVAALDLGGQPVPAPVNLFTGPAPWDPGAPRLGRDLTEGQAWDMVRTAFDVLVPLAEETGVDLAVEGVFGHLVHDYYTTLELLRHYDSPRLGINFDPSHGILVGNDIPWAVRQWGSRIRHIHVKDAVGRPGMFGETFIFPLLGEGQVPWAGFFAALDDIGYRGHLSVEFESWDYYHQVLGGDPIAAARLSIELLRRLDPDMC